MPSFTSVSISFVSNRYEISYVYNNVPPNVFSISAIINGRVVGSPSGTETGTIAIDVGTYPEYFTQGISMDIYCQSDDGPTDSDHLYRVFMKANDTNNRALSSNLRKWIISDSNADYTSILLPPVAAYKNEVFGFKYIDGSASKAFSFVSGFIGYSNAPSSQLFSAVDSNFNGIFDYKFDSSSTSGNIGRITATSAENLLSAAVVSSGSGWPFTSVYFNDSNLSITTASIPASYVTDSNKGILFYECTDANLSTVVISDSIPNNLQKNIFIRNLSGQDLTFYLLAPTGYDFENTSHLSDRSQIAITCSNDKCVNIGLLSQERAGGSNRLYITTLYRGQGLTALTEYPTVPMTTITKDITFVNSVDPSLRVASAQQNSNYARIFTVSATSTGDFSTISTFENNSSNYFVVGGSNQTRTLSLDSNYWYTFASLYKNTSNLILPLNSFVI